MPYAWIIALLAAIGSPACAGPFAPAGGQPGATAIAVADPRLVGWASGATVVRGLRKIDNPSLGRAYYGGTDGGTTPVGQSTANNAPLGMPPQPPTNGDAVALGQGGTATLTFQQPIMHIPGTSGDAAYDFAVFNNGFSVGSLEWSKPAFVEVSSDGVNFFRFPSVSLTQAATQVGSYGNLDPTNLYNLAGKDPIGWGTPFDLGELAPYASQGLNINAVTHVRLVDVVGSINPDYASYDSQGHVVNSPWHAPSAVGSEGFCLVGVGVVHERPSWAGGAAGNRWSSPDNWYGADVTGGHLRLSFNGPNQVSSENDLPVDTRINGISFGPGAGGFTLSGNRAELGGPVVNNSAAAQTIGMDLTLVSGGGLVNTAAGDVQFARSIRGSTGLIKTGPHTLALSGDNSYTGGTIVSQGILEITSAQSLAPGEALTIESEGRVVLAGGLSQAGVSKAVAIRRAPALAPGGLATPIPEPGALALLAAAGIAGLWRCRRGFLFYLFPNGERVSMRCNKVQWWMVIMVSLAAGDCLLPIPAQAGSVTVAFDNLTVPSQGYWNGSDGSGGFTSHGVFFPNQYDATFDSWSGWAYSNVNDTTTSGWGNQYAAYPGKGSIPYAIGFVPADYLTLGFPTVPISVSLGSPTPVYSADFTNTTYAYLSMRDGNDFPGKKFGGPTGNDPDWFKLSITGIDSSGATKGPVEFYLADFRTANKTLVHDWTTVDLTSLGAVTNLKFNLSSSDNGAWGMNTPAYFAMSNLTVPEPSTVGLLAVALLAAGAVRWRRPRARSRA
jgi:autotransporter-associated beta strand protein